MLRYHGVLAAHATARPEVVPGPVAATELEVITKQPARHPWAWLLQRVFAVDTARAEDSPFLLRMTDW